MPRIFITASIAVLAITIMLSSVTATAASRTTQAQWQGETICGGVNLKTGKAMPACGFAKAKYIRKAKKDCPKGAFFDLGTWSCFRCPLGFERTAEAIDGDKACAKVLRKQYISAKYKSKFKSCPGGTFLDPRNGGECWRCPRGYGRTASSVTEWDACGKVGARARSAELMATVCPLGSFPDGRNGGECWQCPDGYLRTSFAVNTNKACYRTEALSAAERIAGNICGEGELFDPIDGGTCWQCPKDSVRTVFSVKSAQACENAEIQWKAAKRNHYSLFHIPGGEGVTRTVIAERTLIDETSRKVSKETKARWAERLAADWALIESEPHESGVLIGAVYAHVLNRIKTGPKTKDERALLGYFAQYVQDTRHLNAIQIRDVYESWRRYSNQRINRAGSKLVQAYNIGQKPPDLSKVAHTTFALTGSGMMLGGFAALAGSPTFAALKGTMVGPFFKAIFPFMGVGKIGMGATTSVSATAAQAVAAASGPLIILTGAVIVGALGIDVVAKNEQAKAKIEDALAIAKRPVVLRRLLLTDKGKAELLTNWMAMTQATKALNKPGWPPRSHGMPVTATVNPAPPVALGPGSSNPPPINDQAVIVQVPTAWKKIPGKGRDISVSRSGVPWLVTERRKRGGFALVLWEKNKWKEFPFRGGVTVATAGPSPIVIDDEGKVRIFSSGKWQDLFAPGRAFDVAASEREIWMVGAGKTSGGYKIYRYQRDRWLNIKGGATRIALQGPIAWVVNDRGNIYRLDRSGGRKWRQIKGPKAVDVAALGESVWITGGAGGSGGHAIHKWDGKGWRLVSGAKAERIAVGPKGQPWVVNDKGAVLALITAK